MAAAFDGMPSLLLENVTMSLRVYQRGEPAIEFDVLPVLRMTVPGFAELRYLPDRTIVGGEPLPGGEYEHVGDGYERYEAWGEACVEAGDEVSIRADWAGIDLPDLADPILPPGTSVEVSGQILAYGARVDYWCDAHEIRGFKPVISGASH